MVAIVLSWPLLAGIYLALVGTPGLDEAVAAVLCGGLGALWVRQIGRRGDETLLLPLEALTPLLLAAVALPGQTLHVGARLWRAALEGGVTGEDRAVPPRAVARCPMSADDPASAGACAVSVLAASLSQDAYVLRREPERGRILVHAILPEGGGTHPR